MNTKTFNILLWIIQGLLAAMFLMAGAMKSFSPIEALAPNLPWVTEVPSILVRFIGLSELLGGIGLILPSLLRIQPKLTPYAALGLVVVMVLAACFHGYKGEYPAIGINAMMGLLAYFVYWGRTQKAVIAPK